MKNGLVKKHDFNVPIGHCALSLFWFLLSDRVSVSVWKENLQAHVGKRREMSQFQTNKFNVAWFKLAEFVARKEKERALGVYRLLVHSLPEESLAAQLEGDLLLAFNDTKALECYEKAANLYERDGKIIQAVAVREHCALLDTENPEHFEQLVRLYAELKDIDKLMRALENLIKSLVRKDRASRALEIIAGTALENDRLCIAYELLVCEFLGYRPFNKTLLYEPLNFIITHYNAHASHPRITSFLGTLAALSKEAHEYVVAALTHGVV